MKKILITGSNGLLGSEAVHHFAKKGWKVIGIDNDMRGQMFGGDGSTKSIRDHLVETYTLYQPLVADIREYNQLEHIFMAHGPFDFIIHSAAQPAHEWSTNNALADFSINAQGTINVLEAYRHYSPECRFIHVSSSKVYGDSVNELPLKEFSTRLDLEPDHPFYEGVDETMRLDGNLHSLFGASKACGDITAKEYGTYFNLPVTILRPVCITGSAHKGVSIHGYLSYLVRCVAQGIKYTVNGYGGKQVRDNIHARDLVDAMWEIYADKECKPGEAYNIGAGRFSNNSILEALELSGKILGKKPIFEIVDQTRRGDHKWCIYSAKKLKARYPNWTLKYDNQKVMEEICSQYESNT